MSAELGIPNNPIRISWITGEADDSSAPSVSFSGKAFPSADGSNESTFATEVCAFRVERELAGQLLVWQNNLQQCT